MEFIYRKKLASKERDPIKKKSTILKSRRKRIRSLMMVKVVPRRLLLPKRPPHLPTMFLALPDRRRLPEL